eukprot:TRINITY_DN92006_c0_g1_i1.p1 TRINITY_DN92006_c0_g1~~TRINITY_DN92006_c0_g1_i1.p1  ORF type:complete len:232 (-),score=80.01 TRINITY_DN92006_c0_g1_i1:73-768(-)
MAPCGMMPADRRKNRSLLAAVLGCVAAAAVMFSDSAASFVGLPLAADARGERVAMNSKVTRQEGYRRRSAYLKKRKSKVLLDGVEVSLDYKDRLRPKSRDKAFAASAATEAAKEVTFDMRPFGIVRWKPGKGNKGAMVMSVSQSFYTTDPQGQARQNGVTPGMVVKSIAGQDVSSADFLEIMQMMGDEALGEWQEGRLAGEWQAHETWESKAKPCPLKVEFATIPGFGSVQ